MVTQKIIQGNQNTTKLINQLKTAAKQYPPLNKEQEQQLIQQYKTDRNKLNQLLFMHNVKIVFNIVKKYTSKTRDFDNLVQEGMKGLAEAASRFDIEKGTKFVTYAGFWIKKFILATFDEKRNWIDHHSTSLNSPALQQSSKGNGQEVTFENFINCYIEPSQNNSKTIQSELSSNEQLEICKELMDNLEADNSLSSTEKSVFVDYFYNKEKTKDIAAKYNIEIPKVFEIRNTILSKFKDILVNQYQIKSYDDVME